MKLKRLDQRLTSTVTGKLQTTIPARLARKRGIKTGMRLEWIESGDEQVITARILPDPMAGLRKAQGIAAKSKRAAAKLMSEFEAERAWQREKGPTV
jgi:bifunctional DNA-binding transcriptional regulator/antitoxin component of YhaV-PrlF toxin-antitoxin module